MGGAASKDVLQIAEQKTLDISHHLTPEQYSKHVKGECLDGSLLDLPWEMYYNSVSLYENVDASFNFIGSIPAELSLHVPHLRHLDLSHNQLLSLPNTFQLLLHLRCLYLSYNRFKNFPATALVNLPHLHTLDLSHNNLRELPQHGWATMKELERLNVSYNQLHLLPNSLARCPKLSVLVVKGNRLMHPPAHVCSEGSDAVLAYLREQGSSSNTRPEYTGASAPSSPVFSRVRGDHVVASVNNPESAWRQYQQGSYTGPGSKRKCPMMPPKDATTLSPHSLTQALMGLVYGAVVAEAVGLSCEGLSSSETRFYYSPDTLAPDMRIRDHIRSHYPKQDWGPLADLMLTTLESVLRWGGVVDELEWAAQVHQWTVHGFTDVDDRPGAPISPLLTEVFRSEGYAVNPYVSAESLYRRLSVDPGSGSQKHTGVDSFSVSATTAATTGTVGHDSEQPLLHVNDNSCLPFALIMGLPSFSQCSEVQSNAERICRASHAAPAPRAAAVMVASLVAAILQGRLEAAKHDPSALETVLDELFNAAINPLLDSLEKAILIRAWEDNLCLEESDLPSSHVVYTLVYLKKALRTYCPQVWKNNEAFTENVSGTSRRSILSSASSDIVISKNCDGEDITGIKTMSRMLSDNALNSKQSLDNFEQTGDQQKTNGADKQLDRSRSLSDAKPNVRFQLSNELSKDPGKGENGSSQGFPFSRSAAMPVGAARSSVSNFGVASSEAFKGAVSDVCLKGEWGVSAHACVIGGVLGALGGFNALPKDWLKKMGVTNKRYLNSKVNLLLDLFGLP